MKQTQGTENPLASGRTSESGQTTVLLLVVLGVFLLGSVGFAVDLSNIWFHRQAAQTAADAACVAGAMDMLYLNAGTISSSPSFTPGAAGDCTSSPLASLCQYAAFNGYTANTSASGWGCSGQLDFSHVGDGRHGCFWNYLSIFACGRAGKAFDMVHGALGN
jgi:hypothetical protein